jgi:hemolysin activation/secretion protein
MLQKFGWPVVMCVAWPAAMAQTLPSAGGQMQQIPPTPVAPVSPPRLRLQPPAAVPAATGAERSFVAQQLRITGAHVYTEAELIAVSGFEPGRAVSLLQLQAMAEKITQHYRLKGLLVARAYLPAQQIQNGVVNLTVLEGRYGQIALNNTSDLNNRLPQELLSGLEPGDVILREPLEERLLLLSDVPGVQVRSTLLPGAALGLSDLVVEVLPGAAISGSVDADNAGSRYTGENRLGATLHWNNPTGQGDRFTWRGLSSGAGLRYWRAAYQTPVGRGQVGAAYSDLTYALGHDFKALDANGRARMASVFGTYPLIRSKATHLQAGLTLEAKLFQDRLDAVPSVTDKRVRVATATLEGDHSDAWGAGGTSRFSLALSGGHVDIQTPLARAQDAGTAASQGAYNKLSWHVSRLQQADHGLSFSAALSGQFANKNLDVSEKMELGGMYGVRAYPQGEAYADEAWLLTLEARKQLELPSTAVGQVHFAAFIDAGGAKPNHSPWTADAQRHLTGAGVGVYWTQTRDFSVKAFYARKLGDEQALSAPDKSGRLWVQAVKYF